MGTPPIQMANLGMADSLILMVMALVVFGPRRLPQIGRQIGKLMYEFRKASNDFKFQMEEELRSAEEADRRKKEEERLRALAAATPVQPALAESSQGTSLAGDSPAPTDPFMAGEGSDGSGRAPVKLEAPIEENYPRILPPSTGEPVAAARPNSLTVFAQQASESGAAVAVEPEPAPVAPATADPEQAAHHG